MRHPISDNGRRVNEVVSVSERFGRTNAVGEPDIRLLNDQHDS